MDQDLDRWNPMEKDYRDRTVNSYREGIGRDLQSRDQKSRLNQSERGHNPVDLYVTNVPLDVDETVLMNIFVQQGTVVKVHIPKPLPSKVNQYGSKIAFVTMENAKGAQAAIENLNGFLLKRKNLMVKVKLSKEELQRRKERNELEEQYLQKLTSNRANAVKAAAMSKDIQNVGKAGAPVQLIETHPGPHGDMLPMYMDLNSRAKMQTAGRGSLLGIGPQPLKPASLLGSDDGINICAFCKTEAKLRCQACKTTYYCCADCQRKDWALHRQSCVYEQRAPADRVPVASSVYSVPTKPDFENIDVSVEEGFVSRNSDYLNNWLRTATVHSHTSQPGSPLGIPKFSAPGSQRHEALPAGRPHSQQQGQQISGLQENNTHDVDKKRGSMQHKDYSRPQQRRNGEESWNGLGQFQQRKNEQQYKDDSEKKFPQRNRNDDRTHNQPWKNGTGLRQNGEQKAGQFQKFEDGPERNDYNQRVQSPPKPGHAGVGQKKKGSNNKERLGPEKSSGSQSYLPSDQNKKSRPKQNPGSYSKQQEEPNKNKGDRSEAEPRKDGKDCKEAMQKARSPPKSSKPPAAGNTPALSSASSTTSASSMSECENRDLPPLSASPVSSNTLKMNKPISVSVSYMESPQSFWVQCVEQCTTLLPLLNEALSNYTLRDPPAVAHTGEVFICEYEGELARVQVVSVFGNNVEIFYMDYGNSEKTLVSKLLPVSDEIAAIPPLAVHCCLPLSPSNGKEWSADVISKMKELFESNELCTLTPVNKNGPITEVSLVRNSDSLDATRFLIENGFDVEKMHVAKIDLPVCAAHRVMANNMPSVMERLSVGQQVEVVLMETTGPMNIFTRIYNLERDFNDFSRKMLADYSSSPEVPYSPVVGELVVGRFSEDKSWYRAEVLSVTHENEEASLFYVDYGNKECLPFRELRAIKSEYASAPIHGFNCALNGIHTPSEDQESKGYTEIYVTCIQKYLVPENDVVKCMIVVKSMKDKVLWMDIVNEQCPKTLAEALSQQLETVLPQTTEPQVLSGFTPIKQDVIQASTGAPSVSPVKQNAHQNLIGSPSVSTVKQDACRNLTDGPSVSAVKRGQIAANFETASLSLATQHVCGIQDIISCQEFYVNKKEVENDLNALRETLNTFCIKFAKGQPKACESASEGNLVLVQFSADNEWYRGKVRKVSEDGSTCTVFFLDYGNVEEKAVSSLTFLPPQFKKMPFQAIACMLAGVQFPVSEEVNANFKHSCLQTEVVVKAVGKQDYKYLVEMYTADNHSVAAAILSIQSEQKISQVKHAPCFPHAAERVQSATGLMLSPVDVSSSLAVSKEQSSPLDLLSCASPKSADKRLTRDSLQQVVPENELTTSVIVSHINSPAQFFVVGLEHWVALHDEKGLGLELQLLNKSSQPLRVVPSVGDLLCGLFEGEWFRCEVIRVTVPKIWVNFFDYGNEVEVDLSELRPLPRDICERYPLATFCCSVDGISPATGDKWSEESVDLMRKLLENSLSTLTVKSRKNDIYNVELSTATGQNVAVTLVKSGQAVWKAPVQSNAEKEELLRQMMEIQAKLAAMDGNK